MSISSTNVLNSAVFGMPRSLLWSMRILDEGRKGREREGTEERGQKGREKEREDEGRR